MPFYDYICEKCGKVFDRMLTVERRDENQVCPDCGGQAVRKVISSFNPGGQSHVSTGDSCSGG